MSVSYSNCYRLSANIFVRTYLIPHIVYCIVLVDRFLDHVKWCWLQYWWNTFIMGLLNCSRNVSDHLVVYKCPLKLQWRLTSVRDNMCVPTHEPIHPLFHRPSILKWHFPGFFLHNFLYNIQNSHMRRPITLNDISCNQLAIAPLCLCE